MRFQATRLIRAAKTSDQLRAEPEYRSVKNDNILQGSQLDSRGKSIKSYHRRNTFYPNVYFMKVFRMRRLLEI